MRSPKVVSFLIDHDIHFDDSLGIWYWGNGHDRSKNLRRTLAGGLFDILLDIYKITWDEISGIEHSNALQLHELGLVKNMQG